MVSYVVYCINIFFIVLEVIVLLYLIRHMLPFGEMFVLIIDIIAAPMIEPMQKLLRRSILGCFNLDMSPYFLIIILTYLNQICEYILKLYGS